MAGGKRNAGERRKAAEFDMRLQIEDYKIKTGLSSEHLKKIEK
jgi:hypothetical protein